MDKFNTLQIFLSFFLECGKNILPLEKQIIKMNTDAIKKGGDKKDVRDLILESLDGRTLTWLATKTGITYTTIYATLKKKHLPLTQDRLDLINKILNTRFTL